MAIIILELNARSEPKASGTVLGSQPKGTPGIVVEGPWYWNQRWWWQVDYEQGPNGWSAQRKLKKVSGPSALYSRSPAPVVQ